MHHPIGKQEQKSRRAREAICEATVTCLAERGYAETSISRVVEQAGVSKGALQHHYPSKEALMASTASFLLKRPLRLADLSSRETSRQSIRIRLLAIWDNLTNTRAYLALLEILIAARTDKLLHARIADGLQASIKEIDAHFLPRYDDMDHHAREELLLLMTANRCLMRGLLIEEQYGLSKTRQRQVLESWLDLVVPEFEQKSGAASAGINGEKTP
jgi:AcrR family transcriptional regulator